MDREADLLSGLNVDQASAVTHDAGPLAVLAGPGTGKTRVITHRVAYMVLERRIEPERIVAVTYTVKAAAELRGRLTDLIGAAAAERVNAHTFHGLGFGLVRRYADMLGLPSLVMADDGARRVRGNLIDSAQQRRLLRAILREHREAGPGGPATRRLFDWCAPDGEDAVIERLKQYFAFFGDHALFPPEVQDFADRAEKLLTAGRSMRDESLDDVAVAADRNRLAMLRDAGTTYRLFREACRARGLLSYADLILLPISLLRESSRAASIIRDEWRHFVVDEFQDVNAAMIEFLRLLAPPASSPDLCVVGDDDQAIYQFRGADERAFHHFSMTWPGSTRIDLSETYRSDGRIISVANSIMSRAEARFAPEKIIRPPKAAAALSRKPDDPAVEVIHLGDDNDDAAVIASMIKSARANDPAKTWKNFAVVVRLNGHGSIMQSTLTMEGIPSLVRTPPDAMQDEGVKDVLAWSQVLADPDAVMSAFRVMIRPPLNVPLEDAADLREQYGAARSRFKHGAAPDPDSFVAWLGRHEKVPDGAARFLELHRELSAVASHQSASRAIAAILGRVDPAHAETLAPDDRARRVKSLITLLRFATEREDRLDAPGDLPAFLAYMSDLDSDEKFGSLDAEDSIDRRDEGDEEVADAVHIITAHSSKGLEFDTVFVPRISPSRGYPQVRVHDDGVEFPPGLIDDPASVDERSRMLAEERRVFYVACTRAKSRLVLLAKKNKSKSKSMHLLEELVSDASLSDALHQRHGSDCLGPPAPGTAGATAEQAADAARLDSQVDASAPAGPESARASLLRGARREARELIEGAMVSAGARDDADTARAAALAAAEGAARLSIIAHLERHGAAPKWAVDLGPQAAVFARNLDATLARGSDAAAAARASRLPGIRPPLKLSFSAIETYLRCPRCFYVRQVLQLSSPPDPKQAVGTIAHQALEKFFSEHRRADAGERPPPTLDDLVSFAREAFFECALPGRTLEQSLLDQVVAQLKLVHERLFTPDAHVLELERTLEFPFGAVPPNPPHTITARLDRVDQIALEDGSVGFAIIDYKTGKPSKAKLSPSGDDLQLGAYALALAHDQGIPPEELRGRAEYWLLATGERGAIAFEKLKLEKVRSKIQEAINGILAGNFSRGDNCRGDCNVLGPGDALL